MKRNLLQSVKCMLLFALAGAFILPAIASAGTEPLVSTEWLANNLEASDLVIIDVRTETNYGVGHIPGSVNMAYSGWQPFEEFSGCQLMPTAEDFTTLMQSLGINDSTHVVVYDHGNSISDATKGGAAVWILRAMGHKHVSYLDGGFTKWTFEGRIIDNMVPEPARGKFTARLDTDKVASLEDVEKALKDKKAVFLDLRTPEQHFGVDKRGDVERYGHIPGAISLPANYLTNAGANRAPATIKGVDELKEIVRGVGLLTDKNTEIIVYCNSCQFAGLGYFVLQEILGYTNVKAYDGSMLEYAAMEDLPLVRYAWGHLSR